MLVRCDGHGDPLVITGTRVDTLRGGVRTAISVTTEQGPTRGVLHHLFRSRVEDRLDHGRFHQPSAAAPIPRDEGQHGGKRRVHAGQRVTGSPHEYRRAFGVSRQPRHAGQTFHRLCESRSIPPRAVETEGRHTDHDELVVERMDSIPVEAKLLHDPRGEILHQDVGSPQQTLQHLCPFRARKIKGDAAFPDVGGVEDRAPLPPAIVGRWPSTGETHVVGSGQ